MTVEPISTFGTLLYWVYLVDPFTRRPLRRNYLKLYENKKYLIINVIISLIPIYIVINWTSTDPTAFSTLPLCFILSSLLFTKLAIDQKGRPFKFIQRYDLLKIRGQDLTYSVLLMLIPLLVSVLIDIQILF